MIILQNDTLFCKMNANLEVTDSNTGCVIYTIPSGLSILDYKTSNEIKTLLGLRDQIDIAILNTLILKKIVIINDSIYENCKLNNPILDQYNHWENNWRKDSTSSSYEWRLNSETFFSLQTDWVVEGTLKDYLKHLSSFKVTSTPLI